MTSKLGAVLVWAAVLLPAAAVAGEADRLAKAAQNPLATMVSLPLQSNWNTGVGAYDRVFYNLNIQPVVPVPGERWNVINRTIIPLNSVPVDELGSVSGLGDTLWQVFLSPNGGEGFTWGAGPVFSLPTASNPEMLGSGKWGVGPTGVLFGMLDRWTLGFVASNVWSFAGNADRDEVNLFTLQYFLNYNFGGGWAVGTAPFLAADWTADADERWTVPWGLQVSKVTHIGARPVNLMAGYYRNSEHPTAGPEGQVKFQVNFLFPASN